MAPSKWFGAAGTTRRRSSPLASHDITPIDVDVSHREKPPSAFAAVHAYAKAKGWSDNDPEMIDRWLVKAGFTDPAEVVALLVEAVKAVKTWDDRKLATRVWRIL